MTPSGIEPTTFRLVKQCLNQLRYRVPPPLFKGYRWFFTGVRRSGREADNSPPSSVEVKNGWRYTSALYVFLLGVPRNNFIVYLLHYHLHKVLCVVRWWRVVDICFASRHQTTVLTLRNSDGLRLHGRRMWPRLEMLLQHSNRIFILSPYMLHSIFITSLMYLFN